jgi:hypothetical protein
LFFLYITLSAPHEHMFFSGCVVAFYLILDTLLHNQFIGAKLQLIPWNICWLYRILGDKLEVVQANNNSLLSQPCLFSLLCIHCFSSFQKLLFICTQTIDSYKHIFHVFYHTSASFYIDSKKVLEG